jgi:hypothetical protein
VKFKPLTKFLLVWEISVLVWMHGEQSRCLKKTDCKHAKYVIQPEFKVSVNDIKDPSPKDVELGGKFYSDIWLAGGRQMVNEVVRDSEGEISFEC